jgi:hypothetical protein
MEEGDGTGAACVRSTDASDRFDHDQLAGLPRDGRRQAESLAPRERARRYSKICERPDVREARSSDTRPAKWEHTWFARQRRIGGRGHSFAVAIWEGEEKMLKVRRIWPRFVYIRICKSALYSIRVNQECL